MNSGYCGTNGPKRWLKSIVMLLSILGFRSPPTSHRRQQSLLRCEIWKRQEKLCLEGLTSCGGIDSLRRVLSRRLHTRQLWILVVSVSRRQGLLAANVSRRTALLASRAIYVGEPLQVGVRLGNAKRGQRGLDSQEGQVAARVFIEEFRGEGPLLRLLGRREPARSPIPSRAWASRSRASVSV